jgi:hypothetical protein
MKNGARVLAVLLLLIGLVWIGQGLGYIKGSFMTGQMLWFWIGVGCVVGSGVVLSLSRGIRRPTR